MFITLTNSSTAHRGNKIAIQSDLIVTIHHSKDVLREDGTVEEATFVFVPPHGTWEVTETLEEVMEMLK